MDIKILAEKINPYPPGPARAAWKAGFFDDEGYTGSRDDRFYVQGKIAGKQVRNILPPRCRPKTEHRNHIFTLVVERDGEIEDEIDLYDPFEPVEQVYIMDTHILEDELLQHGWKPTSVDVYTRTNDRRGYIIIRCEANKLPSLGPYKIYVREEPIED